MQLGKTKLLNKDSLLAHVNNASLFYNIISKLLAPGPENYEEQGNLLITFHELSKKQHDIGLETALYVIAVIDNDNKKLGLSQLAANIFSWFKPEDSETKQELDLLAGMMTLFSVPDREFIDNLTKKFEEFANNFINKNSKANLQVLRDIKKLVKAQVEFKYSAAIAMQYNPENWESQKTKFIKHFNSICRTLEQSESNSESSLFADAVINFLTAKDQKSSFESLGKLNIARLTSFNEGELFMLKQAFNTRATNFKFKLSKNPIIRFLQKHIDFIRNFFERKQRAKFDQEAKNEAIIFIEKLKSLKPRQPLEDAPIIKSHLKTP